MRGVGCQARERTLASAMGWRCEGRGLTILLMHHGTPAVLPDPMVADALAEQPWLEPRPFADGDHLRMVAPDVWLHA